MKKLHSGSLLPGISCLKIKSNPIWNKAIPALLLKGQSQKQLFAFWRKETTSLQESKDEALSTASPDLESSGGPPREPSGEPSSESYQVKASQKRGVKVLEQGLSTPLAETVEIVQPAWSTLGPQLCPSSSSAWPVCFTTQADLAPKFSQKCSANSSKASVAIGPCDFTLRDLDPDLFQRYGPQANDPAPPSVDPRSKGLPTPSSLELFNSTLSLQDSLIIHSHFPATPALEVSGIQLIQPSKSEARLSASLFNLENLIASIVKLLEKFVGGLDCILDSVTAILVEMTKDKKIAKLLDPIQTNVASSQLRKDQRSSWASPRVSRRERICEDVLYSSGKCPMHSS
ncbi:hypothetical protein NDU88_000498 [Pleurodeles waltl]|uniref:Uncharacterized protein n=1 Tax=Pleurodeles waltl TaxID=8319 RepID=A0AAV7P183_PLEWA|nr:hypothetical protein NDU88_000498 [Pleurodeles waltl]